MPGRVRPLDLIIQGVNRVDATIVAVNQRVNSMVAPIARVNAAMASMSTSMNFPALMKNFSSIGTEARKLATKATVAFAAAAYGMRRFISEADEIGATASKIGITTDALQELRYAAGQLDVDTATVDKALGTFNKNIVDFGRGAGRARWAFRFLEIDMEKSKGTVRSTTDLFEEFTKKLEGVKDPKMRSRLVLAGFGDADMVNMIGAGSKQIAALSKEARDLGIVLDAQTIQAANDADNELRRLGVSAKATAYRIGADLIPLVIEISEGMRGWLNENREWLRESVVPAVQALASGIGTCARAIQFITSTTAGMVLGMGAAIGWIAGPFILSLVQLGSTLMGTAAKPGILAKAIAFVSKQIATFVTRAVPMMIAGLQAIAVFAAANPITAVALAVAALAVGGLWLYNNFKPVRDLFDGIWKRLQSIDRFSGSVLRAVGIDIGGESAPYVLGPRTGPAELAANSAAALARQPRARDYVTAPQAWRGDVGIQVSAARGTTASVSSSSTSSPYVYLDIGRLMNPAGG